MFLEVDDACATRGIEVARSLVGPYVTSLDMAGCSVTLTRATPEILELWDAPVTDARPALVAVHRRRRRRGPGSAPSSARSASSGRRSTTSTVAAATATSAATCCRRSRARLEGAGALSPGRAFTVLGRACMAAGGTSGPLFGVWFRELGRAGGDEHALDLGALAVGAAAGLEAVCKLGGARAGDKTMVDAMEPAAARAHERPASAARRWTRRSTRPPRRRARAPRGRPRCSPGAGARAMSARPRAASRTPARSPWHCSSRRIRALRSCRISYRMMDLAHLVAEPLHIGGTWRPASGDPLAVVDPATEQTLAEVPSATVAEVHDALAAARAAQPAWAATSPITRGAHLRDARGHRRGPP